MFETLQEIFQARFLDNMTATPFPDIAFSLLISFCMGLLIFWVYKRTYTGVVYSGSFGVSLIAMALITNLLILVVTSNLVLTLGTVGALSIVRFRTAIKDPLDIVFLFWSISCGIIIAAGLVPLAVFGSVLIGVVLMVFSSKSSTDNSAYILMVVCDDKGAEDRVLSIMESGAKKAVLKSKSISKGSIELNFEVRLKRDETSFINEIAEENGVINAVLVSYNGDYTG